jgi:hypothetical protein
MAKKNEQQNLARRPSEKHAPRFLIAVVLCAAIVAVVMAVYFFSGRQSVTDTSAPTTGIDIQVLKGRWLRPDGGYILEIRNVADDGRIEAGYYNPKPIRVSKAEVSRTGSTMNVFLELRDTGYPGCTYTMLYDPRDDVMKGVYYQAAIQESFEIVFVRMK